MTLLRNVAEKSGYSALFMVTVARTITCVTKILLTGRMRVLQSLVRLTRQLLQIDELGMSAACKACTETPVLPLHFRVRIPNF
jgi:hypothetical protein